VGQSSKQCSYVAMQLQRLTDTLVLWTKAASNAATDAMQLQNLTNMHIFMGQSSKQCSYVVMQLQKLID